MFGSAVVCKMITYKRYSLDPHIILKYMYTLACMHMLHYIHMKVNIMCIT